MLKSIKWSLQLWHAGLLAVVILGFGSMAYYGISKSRYDEIDAELERSVQMLAASIHIHPPAPGPRFGLVLGPADGPDMENRPGQQPESMPAPGYGRRTGPERPGRPGDGHDAASKALEFEVPAALAGRLGDVQSGMLYYAVWDSDGTVASASRNDDLPRPDKLQDVSSSPPSWRVPVIRQRSDLREAFSNGPFGICVLVGRSVLPVEAELRKIVWLLAGAGAGVLVLGLAGGWLLSSRAVRPIRAITATAKEITAANLSRRIDSADTKSELGELAQVLNNMFAKLDEAFQQQVRFTADASHELRTPLAVIYAHCQLALAQDRPADEYRRTIETCLRTSTRMKSLVDSLLLLARADSGRLHLDPHSCDLKDIAAECLTMAASLATEKGVTIQADLQPAPLVADAPRIAQVVTNLLTNAIRYNRPGGQVRVSVAPDKAGATMTIADTGLGIAQEHLKHLFERFYCVEESRNRQDGGCGLGLAICKSIVETHSGSITVDSKVGQGTTFTVRLPTTQPEQNQSPAAGV